MARLDSGRTGFWAYWSMIITLSSFCMICNSGKYFSVDFTPGRPALVAEGFGLKALEVNGPAELDAALDKALNSTEPVFLDVKTQPEVDHLPPVCSWLEAAQKTSVR